MGNDKKVYTARVIEKILPERLKIFRKNAGLTTNEVGKLLNKTPSAITLWETGKALPDVYTLLKLCDMYKVADLNEFLEVRVPPDIKSLSRSEQEFIKLLRGSSSDVKTAIKILLKQCNK